MRKLINTCLLLLIINLTGNGQWINLYNAEIYDVSFPTSTVGYMTFGKNVKKTIDGGQTWKILTTGSSVTLGGIQFLTVDIGYVSQAASASILKTVDGGISWTPILTHLPIGNFKFYFCKLPL